MSRIFGTEVRSIGNGDDLSERRRPSHLSAPTGSRKGKFNCDPDSRRTLGFMTPAGVYTENMPSRSRFKCDSSLTTDPFFQSSSTSLRTAIRTSRPRVPFTLTTRYPSVHLLNALPLVTHYRAPRPSRRLALHVSYTMDKTIRTPGVLVAHHGRRLALHVSYTMDKTIRTPGVLVAHHGRRLALTVSYTMDKTIRTPGVLVAHHGSN
ncbi:hypothetical protein Bbelb_192770 [Branchiostoma belcheri]|nr:hypothetical protein Bbelb_192770 [Branchiostoma belcheri]